MAIFNNSKMTTLYYSDTPALEDYPCTVRIDEKAILIEYDDEGIIQYYGENNGNGHFELKSDKVNGRATLHMFPDSIILEGSWIEDNYRGMWRITLN